MYSTKEKLLHNVYNIPGWRTKRHIIVIESDDWGSIRMPSKEVYEDLVSKGVKFSNYGYDFYDTLASREDLQKMFEVCDSVRDINNNPAVITANCVVANPDFVRIMESDFREYYYEPITDTLSRYYPNADPFPLWIEGIKKGCFYPQLHGREHVNVQMWMNSLRENHKGARDAFEKGVWSVVVSKDEDIRQRNTTAFKYLSDSEKPFYKQSIKEAQELFNQMFGYKSKSFISPAYSWDEDIEQWLNDNGVKYIQGLPMHFYHGKRHFHYVGKRNKFGQYLLIRNADWEPTQNQNEDNNGECLRQISVAYRWEKPATISIHRLNFIGSLDKGQRDKNLMEFKQLLKDIKKKWPDVEFMTSSELGDLISQK